MTPFVGEITGTALMMLPGNGVVANVLLRPHQGQRRRHHRRHVRLGDGGVCGGVFGAALAASLYLLLRGPVLAPGR